MIARRALFGFLLVAMIALVAACAPAPTPAPPAPAPTQAAQATQAPMKPNLAQLEQQFVDAFNRADFDAFEAMLTDDVTAKLFGTSCRGGCTGSRAVRKAYEGEPKGSKITLLTVQVSDNVVSGRSTIDELVQGGLGRYTCSYISEFRGDKMSRLIAEDCTGPQIITPVP